MKITEVLVEACASFSCSVDRLACSADLRAQFRARLPHQYQSIADDELVRYLLNLRKNRELSRAEE